MNLPWNESLELAIDKIYELEAENEMLREAKYVYASAYDLLETENKRLKAEILERQKTLRNNIELDSKIIKDLQSENQRLKECIKEAFAVELSEESDSWNMGYDAGINSVQRVLKGE